MSRGKRTTGQPEAAVQDDDSASVEPLARQFQKKAVFEFVADHFEVLIGAAAGQVFRTAVRALQDLPKEHKATVLREAEEALPSILKEHYSEEVVDLLLHGDGTWGEQEGLASALDMDDAQTLSRLLERHIFGYVVAVFKAMLTELPTGKAPWRKLDMFSSVVEQLIRNRKF